MTPTPQDKEKKISMRTTKNNESVEFKKLIPETVDIIRDNATGQVLCSRQAISNLIEAERTDAGNTALLRNCASDCQHCKSYRLELAQLNSTPQQEAGEAHSEADMVQCPSHIKYCSRCFATCPACPVPQATPESWEFEKLIPRTVDLIRDNATGQMLCSRQAIVNLINLERQAVKREVVEEVMKKARHNRDNPVNVASDNTQKERMGEPIQEVVTLDDLQWILNNLTKGE